jgi:hypothetical protein
MADRSKKPVELIQVGDYVLGHTLEPQRVTGALEKFLFDDSFYGFSPEGPFFFTDSHLLAGPGFTGDELQLWTVSTERLLSENPLMEFTNVRPMTEDVELLQYNASKNNLRRKKVLVFKDPSSYTKDVMVYSIQVDGDQGTYIANDFICHHETPPLQHWPRTIDLLLRVGSLPHVRKLQDLKYSLENVAMLESLIQNIDNELIKLISALRNNSNLECVLTSEESLDKRSLIDTELAMSQIFSNPTYSAFMVGMYARTGKIISAVLDNQLTPFLEGQLSSIYCLIFTAIADRSEILLFNSL